mmetsp:Transcript_18783/g.46136  ORF Transcript_18783/g.46136 Transcript_18783/m.46136 type:complete len:670 (-) Transcript_18783:37-2046(-)
MSDTNGASFSDGDLTELVQRFRAGVSVQDRKFRATKYKQCFVGSEAVQWLVSSGAAANESDAVNIGNAMMNAGVFHHVLRDHPFKDEMLFYRFVADEDHGGIGVSATTGQKVSWTTFLGDTFATGQREQTLQPKIKQPDLTGNAMGVPEAAMAVSPLDEYNIDLLNKVHPAQWVDPQGKSKYHMVVIGGGSAGLISAAGAAGVGARVALIEGHLLGGDCLNVGCVPSKALIACAKAAKNAKDTARMAEFGVSVSGEVSVDFEKVMQRVRRVRSSIAEADSAERYATKLGVDVYIGYAKFSSKNSVIVNGQTLTFAKAVIATGGSPQIPAVPGLHDLAKDYKDGVEGAPPILTNENVFNLTKQPKRIGVIGTGAIGLELAQSFQRLGSEVVVFGRSGTVMPKEDKDLSAIVLKSLKDDGVEFHLNSEYEGSSRKGDQAQLVIKENNMMQEFLFDAIIVAAGRAPNVSNLNLEVANVEYDPKTGIKIDDSLKTSNPNVFAIGDVSSEFKFTHVSDFMARAVIRNALFFGSEKFSSLIIPWCTYTEPELAHVGLYEKDAEAKGIEVETFEKHLADNDRAICEGDTSGVVRIHVVKGSDKIVGATIVAENAGDMISEITLAMNAGLGLGKIASVIHPYPTEADAIRACGDLYNRTRLTKPVKALFRQILKLKN